MNPIGSFNNGSNNLSPQMIKNIQQVKNIMKMANGNPMQMLQQMNNPMATQVAQMLKTQNPESKIGRASCRERV